MKWNTKKSAKTGLAVFASALTLLLAAVLLGTAQASLSRPVAVPAETSEDRSPSVTVSPVRPVLQTAQEKPPEGRTEPPDAADYDAALADWGEPYGQPEALRQGYCTVNSLAELDGSLCLFASEVGQEGTERTGLAVCDTGDEALEWLIPPTSDVTLGNLQEQNGVLYVMAWEQDTRRTLAAFSQDDLSPVSLYTGNFETYQVYGDMVFLQTADGLWSLPLDGAAAPLRLWEDTDRIELRSFCSTEAGVVVQLTPAHWQEGLQRLYLLPPEGGQRLLFEGTGEISHLASAGEAVYFLYRQEANSYAAQQLVTIPAQGHAPVFSGLPPVAAASDGYLFDFFVSGDKLVFCFRQFDRDCLAFCVTDLQGGILEQYRYDNSGGAMLLDTISVNAMLGRSHLYLQGKSYTQGVRTTTRIQRAAQSDCTRETPVAGAGVS